MRRKQSKMLRTMKTPPKRFKAEGRAALKKKRGLMKGKLYEIGPEDLTLEPTVAGCVGYVRRGTIIRFANKRTTPSGVLYFFDGFKLNEDKNLEWIGEFDRLDPELVAAGCGRQVLDHEYVKILVPDTTGALSATVRDTIIDEGVGDPRTVG